MVGPSGGKEILNLGLLYTGFGHRFSIRAKNLIDIKSEKTVNFGPKGH